MKRGQFVERPDGTTRITAVWLFFHANQNILETYFKKTSWPPLVTCRCRIWSWAGAPEDCSAAAASHSVQRWCWRSRGDRRSQACRWWGGPSCTRCSPAKTKRILCYYTGCEEEHPNITGDHPFFKLLFLCFRVNDSLLLLKTTLTGDHSIFKLLFVRISVSMSRYCCKGKDQPNKRLLLQTALQLCFCARVTAATQAWEKTTLTRDHSRNCSLSVFLSVLLLLLRQGKRPS